MDIPVRTFLLIHEPWIYQLEHFVDPWAMDIPIRTFILIYELWIYQSEHYILSEKMGNVFSPKLDKYAWISYAMLGSKTN